MLKVATAVCAVLVTVAQAQSPFFSFSGGEGPSSSSPFSIGGGGGPSSSSPFSIGGGGGPSSSSPFGSGGGGPPPSSYFGSSSGGPSSSSPFGGGPSSRPGGRGPPRGFPSSEFGRPQRQNSPSKLFSWLGSAMSKFPLPKIHYYSPKSPQKPSSLSSAGQSSTPSYFSSGSPGSLNSIYESSASPFGGAGGSGITFGNPSQSTSLDHPPVVYRSPSGGPPPFPSRPSGFSLFGSRPRPSFSSRPPPSYSSGGPPPQSLSSPFGSSGGSLFGPPRPRPQGLRPRPGGLEVYPSQQVAYQSQSLSQNDPGYEEALGGMHNLYGGQSIGKPHVSASSFNQQQFSYSQPQAPRTPENNYGATFHSIEPVSVAPMYDIGQQIRPSSGDQSRAGSQAIQQQQHQQSGNIHDTPFVTLVNQYAQHADAATAGSEQMMGASDLLSAATSQQAIPGLQVLGQGINYDGNPVFDIVANADAPTYDGHPVDLNKLISMIEPGAQIDTMPSFNGGVEPEMASSEQQGVFAQAPSNLELESDAAMAAIMSGNEKEFVTGSLITSDKLKQIIQFIDRNSNKQNINHEGMHESASESRPTVVKLDGTRLSDDELIEGHFDKEFILDDLQENENQDMGKGFIIMGMGPDNDTGDDDIHHSFDINDHHDTHFKEGMNSFDNNSNRNDTDKNDNNNASTTTTTRSMHTRFDSNNKNDHTNSDRDDLLAIIQQLRNSAVIHSPSYSAVVKNQSRNKTVTTMTVTSTSSDNVSTSASPSSSSSLSSTSEGTNKEQHPNHNYDPNPASFLLAKNPDEHENANPLLADSPVINPIFDSVRPGKSIRIASSTDNDDNMNKVTGHNDDIDNSTSSTSSPINHQVFSLHDDDDDDDDVMNGDDLFIDTDGDMAVSASRNVKSVAVIVTPPPSYVKIKNKYKKVITPLSALTSTTPLSTVDTDASSIIVSTGNISNNSNSSSNSSTRSVVDDDIEEAFSESLAINTYAKANHSRSANDNSNNNGSAHSKLIIARPPPTEQAASSLESSYNININNNNNNSNNSVDRISNNNHDLDFYKSISTISRGIDTSNHSYYRSGANGTTKQPRRYPVYRGRNTNNNN